MSSPQRMILFKRGLQILSRFVDIGELYAATLLDDKMPDKQAHEAIDRLSDVVELLREKFPGIEAITKDNAGGRRQEPVVCRASKCSLLYDDIDRCAMIPDDLSMDVPSRVLPDDCPFFMEHVVSQQK